jgi:hypothetical protein
MRIDFSQPCRKWADREPVTACCLRVRSTTRIPMRGPNVYQSVDDVGIEVAADFQAFHAFAVRLNSEKDRPHVMPRLVLTKSQ